MGCDCRCLSVAMHLTCQLIFFGFAMDIFDTMPLMVQIFAIKYYILLFTLIAGNMRDVLNLEMYHNYVHYLTESKYTLEEVISKKVRCVVFPFECSVIYT